MRNFGAMVPRAVSTAAVCLAFVCLADAADTGKLNAVFGELTRYTLEKSPAPLEQIRSRIRASYDEPEQRKALEDRMVTALGAADTTIEGRRFLCRQLAIIGNEASIPVLEKFLRDADLGRDACYALRGSLSPKAGHAMRESLGEVPLVVRLLALDSDRDPEAAVRKYADVLGFAHQPETKKLVLSGIAGIASADALKLVIPLLDDAAVRDEAALAAVRIARATMGDDRDQTRSAMDKVRAVLKGGPVAAEAGRVIGQIDTLGTDKIPVTLKAGWNPLLLKITQNLGPWGFCARVASRGGRGEPIKGVRMDCMHDGDWTLPAAPIKPGSRAARE